MIHENNKEALDSISPGNPFPSNAISHCFQIIKWELEKVPSSQMSPEKIIELAEHIEWLTFEIKQKVTEWKEKV